MQPHVVVGGFDVVGYVHHGLGMVGVVAMAGPLRLKAQEETFHHRVEAPMSSDRCSVFQISQNEWVQLTNDVAL